MGVAGGGARHVWRCRVCRRPYDAHLAWVQRSFPYGRAPAQAKVAAAAVQARLACGLRACGAAPWPRFPIASAPAPRLLLQIEDGTKQLVIAEKTQKQSRMFICIIALICIIVLLLVIVIIRHH